VTFVIPAGWLTEKVTTGLNIVKLKLKRRLEQTVSLFQNAVLWF